MNDSEKHKIGVITGATGGIGLEIARYLLNEGFTLYLTGRNFDSLLKKDDFQTVYQNNPELFITADLSTDAGIKKLTDSLKDTETINLLIHSAAYYHPMKFDSLNLEELDRSYRVNVRAPFILTQSLLPKLIAANGTVVFLNSSVVNGGGKEQLTAYQSTKAALKGMADCLRTEVNGDGVRVLTAYLGKTATSMQKKACENAGVEYHPDRMIKPESAAKIICKNALAPRDLEVTELHVRPAVSYS